MAAVVYLSTTCQHCREVARFLDARPRVRELVVVKYVDRDAGAWQELRAAGRYVGTPALVVDGGMPLLGTGPVVVRLQQLFGSG